MKQPDTILFDLGGVLVDWNPRYLYRAHFEGDEAAMERFLHEVVSPDWIREMDAGKPLEQAVAERSRRFPAHARLIALWGRQWERTLGEALTDSVEILEQLHARGLRLFALTNWSAETFPLARRRFDFLRRFEHIVVSGEVGLAKPDAGIFRLAIARCALEPARTVFIDDNPDNVAAGRSAGLRALHFERPAQLRADLQALGLLPPR